MQGKTRLEHDRYLSYLLNNPTVGYGIFIENMLAEMGDLAG
jgi:hypothetical protein